MSIVREIPLHLPAFEERSFLTCSTGGQVFSGSTANNLAGGAGTAATVNGTVYDRLSPLIEGALGVAHQVACPSIYVYSSRGSTEANRQIIVGVKLQHGDSSGGGDMADYTGGSTASQAADRTFFSTARSSDQKNWDAQLSSGALYGISNPAYYDIRAAKRYIRVVGTVAKNRVTTESSGDEGMRVGGSLTLMGTDRLPYVPGGSLDPTSTSTST